jgi:hypothetical protein
MLSGELRRFLTVQAPPEIQAMFGTPGEPVPTVDAKDLRAVWELSRRTMALHPGTQGAIGVDLVKLACSPAADVKAVWWRGARLQMFDMLLLNLLCGWIGRPIREIAFLIFAKVPMKWWEIGVPRRGLF